MPAQYLSWWNDLWLGGRDSNGGHFLRRRRYNFRIEDPGIE